MSENQKRKDRIIRVIEKGTEHSLGQQNVQQLMREVAKELEGKDKEKEELEEEKEFEDDEDCIDPELNAIAYTEIKWAKDNNVWPDYLKDVNVPLKRRVRTGICLSLRIPKPMKKELDGKAKFNAITGRIEKVEIEQLSFEGKFDPRLHQKKQLTGREGKKKGSGSNSRPRRRHQSSGSRSGSSRHSRSSTASGSSSVKSILKESKKSSVARKRRSLPKKSKSPAKRLDVRPMGQVSMIKNPVIRHQVRGFVAHYSNDPDFEAFSLMIDGIPFVALSLMNAEPSLRERFKNASPPTPMKKHAPGANSPRKSPLPRQHHESRSSSANSKCVRFTDEGCSPKKAEKSPSAEDEKEFRELGETVSDAMLETDRQYNDLWNDRTNSVERQ